MQDFGGGFHCRCVHGIDRCSRGRREGEMHRAVTAVHKRTEPEVWKAVGP